MNQAIHHTDLAYLTLLHKGKVRDIYQVDDEHLLIIASDRVSAFDVVLPTAIPEKGAILCAVSNFWFEKTKHIIKNHCSTMDLRSVLTSETDYNRLKNHAVIVKKMDNMPVEAIVRGYIIGSGWKEYTQTGGVCGIKLPSDLRLADKLEKPIYTPSTKARVGDHDENITFEETVKLLGHEMAAQVREVSLKIYQFAFDYAYHRGIIIADTKFEFGIDKGGDLVLIDEVLTPDSSRFWDLATYNIGISPPSFDKQIVRDYLEMLDWDKTTPGPMLPKDVANKTYAKYKQVKQLLLTESSD